MLRRLLLLLGIALGGIAHAEAPPRIEVSVTPAWKGWARPGRASEMDLRLTTDTPTRAAVDVVAGAQAVHVDLDLQPGRALRWQVPLGTVEGAVVSITPPVGPPVRREVALAQSESPLLGLGLVTGETVPIEGFHAVALAADDLPRHALAYSSIDALILDTATLGALDQRQLAALLSHAAGCGRIVVVNTDAQVRRVLEGAGGCGGHALLQADSLAQAKQVLEASLARGLPQPMTLGSIGALARPGPAVWNHVAVALAVYLAAAALAVLFFSSLPMLLLTPALASVAVLALLHVIPQPSQLTVWSEAESGAPQARYQAWQVFTGLVRERVRVPIPRQLAAAAQPCEPTQPMRFDFDAGRESAAFAEFETRLFRQVALCYAGSFPVARSVVMATRADGQRELRNAGAKAWPDGQWLAGGLVYDLPALAPGALIAIDAKAGQPLRDAAVRTAAKRLPLDGVAALWALELGGVADAPRDAKGWLLVAVAPP